MSAKVVQGEDKTITVTIKDEDGNVYDLSSVTAVTAEITNNTAPCVSKTLGSGVTILAPANCGKLQIVLDTTDTADLEVPTASLELTLDEGGTESIVQFENAITVSEKIC